MPTPASTHPLSVVLPCRNYATMLPGLFENLSRQTGGLADVEIIFADDASTDGSLETAIPLGLACGCGRFVARAFNPMGHPALTRNAGATLATGDLLLFFDPDDTPEPDMLAAMRSALLSSGADIAYADYIEETPQGSRVVALPDFSAAVLANQNILSVCALMRRTVFDTLGGFRGNSAYEDWDFWVRAAHAGFRFAHIPKPLFRYRFHGGNFSFTARADDGAAKAAIVLNTPDFFDPEVRRWAKALCEGKPWAQPLPRGVIPAHEDVRALRGTWAGMRARTSRDDPS